MSFVTFVIPSMNRSTLYRALESIASQTDSDWSVVIVLDGVPPHNLSSQIQDFPKTTIIYEKKIGHAGILRNIGIASIQQDFPTWIAFLDDDDVIKPTYVESLRNNAQNNDVVISTMVVESNGDIHPNPAATDFVRCDVGISFAVKLDFVRKHNVLFAPGEIEDYGFLEQCRKFGAKYVLTHEIQYLASARNNWNYF